MPTRNHALGLILANTLSATDAARAADELGSAMVDYPPRVPFAPPWVLAHQTSSASIASYVVTHCTDPKTLSIVATTTKRASVKKALLANSHLPASAHKALTTNSVKKTSQPTLTPNPRLAHTRQVTSLAHVSAVEQLSRLSYLASPATSAVLVNEALLTLLDRDVPGVLTSYLCSIFGATIDGWYYEFWKKSTITPQTALSHLLPADRASALRHALLTMCNAVYDKTDPSLIPLSFIKLLMRHVTLSYSDLTPDIDRACVHALFTPEAAGYLLDSSWWPLLSYHTMTPAQMTRFITHSFDISPVDLLELTHSDPEVLRVVLSAIPLSQKIGDLTITPQLAKLMPAADTSLRTLFLDHLSVESTLNYMTGAWAQNPGAVAEELLLVLPSPDMIPDLLTRLSGVERSKFSILVRDFVLEVLPIDPPDYLNAFVDQVPYALSSAIEVPILGAHIYDRLSGTGASLDLIADQLCLIEDRTLDQLYDGLAALVRATAESNRVRH